MSEINEISVRLQQWVASTGKKKGEIASELGISSSQFSQLLAGKDGLGKTMQERLEKAGADVPYILTGRRAEDTARFNPLHYIRSLEREIEFLKQEREQYLKVLKTYNVEQTDTDYALAAEPVINYNNQSIKKVQE